VPRTRKRNQPQSDSIEPHKVIIIACDTSIFGNDVIVQYSPLNARPIGFHACSISLIAVKPLSAMEILVKREAERERETLEIQEDACICTPTSLIAVTAAIVTIDKIS